MASRSPSSTLTGVGVIGVIASIVWWQEFYRQVSQALGAKGPLPIECLYQTVGPCSVVTTLAAWGGVMPYNPELFWASVVAIALGTVLWFVDAVRQEIEPPENYSSSSKPQQPGRTQGFW